MPRNRTITPHFSRTPYLTRVSRDARLCFILLWTVVDDAGRMRPDYTWLLEQLFPHDPDAPQMLRIWLDELDSAGCIERYRVEDVDLLQVRHWRQLQTIDRPTPSRLPPSPSEPAREAREPREESPRMQTGPASEANPREDANLDTEAEEVGDPTAITPERVLSDLDIVLRKARRKDRPSSADARFLELAGRRAGLWGGRGAAPAGAAEACDDEDMGPSPAELLRPPGTSA
jgi:hypothetical protein